MNKAAPSLPRIIVMVVFALSCFLILTYLWTSFGGPTPLGAQGYRFQVDFDEATQLADNADVIAIRKIKPMAMPRIRFRMVGRSIDVWSKRTVMIGKRDEATKAKARPIWPGLLFSARW